MSLLNETAWLGATFYSLLTIFLRHHPVIFSWDIYLQFYLSIYFNSVLLCLQRIRVKKKKKTYQTCCLKLISEEKSLTIVMYLDVFDASLVSLTAKIYIGRGWGLLGFSL